MRAGGRHRGMLAAVLPAVRRRCPEEVPGDVPDRDVAGQGVMQARRRMRCGQEGAGVDRRAKYSGSAGWRSRLGKQKCGGNQRLAPMISPNWRQPTTREPETWSARSTVTALLAMAVLMAVRIRSAAAG